MSRIAAGPPVKANNMDYLQSFTGDVKRSVETLRSMKELTEVDTRSWLVKLTPRLPEYLRTGGAS